MVLLYNVIKINSVDENKQMKQNRQNLPGEKYFNDSSGSLVL